MPPQIREILDRLKHDGWMEVAQKGSHRQFKHLDKPDRVTVPGKSGDDVPSGTLDCILKQARLKRWPMRYAIVIEKAESNYAVYVPDLIGCISTGPTVAEVEQGIREAIELHIAGLREDGQFHSRRAQWSM